MFFVGVDAGGTKTAFVLSDGDGNILARCQRGSGSFFKNGADGLYALVAEGVAALCTQAGIGVDDITFAGLGFPGYGEGDGSEQAITSACEKAIAPGRIVCDCDCYLGWAGSLAMRPGINIVSGTGSIGYGVNEQKETARCGGWGAFCDEGSCRWLGGRLLQLFTRQSDGRMPRTVLYEMMREHLSISHDLDFVQPINHVYGVNAAKTATLQQLLADIYDAGDPHAKALYEEAAYELALVVSTIADKLGMEAGYLVSYSGGLYKSGTRIIEPLREKVERAGGKLTAPRFTPELGAVLMAMRRVWPDKDFNAFTFTEKVKQGE